MLVLRCTSRLLDRMKVAPETALPSSTTRLGDVYANLLHVGRTQLVLAVSERTLLPVLVHAAPANSLVPRVRAGIVEVLRALDVPEEAVRAEEGAVQDVVIAKTASKVVLGMMNDFAGLTEVYFQHDESVLDVSLRLAKAPCKPIDMESPQRATRQLFARSS